jgi:DtxR family transcriptional regulator, Mn-dependent transcriptional regulator
MPTISASLEDYLEAIFILQTELAEVRVKDISEYLDVKPPSVIDALKLLKNKRLVLQEKYSSIELTSKGKKIAKDIVKKHDVIKVFLVKALGLDEETADKDACKIEHSLSKKTVMLIKKYLKKKPISN